MPSFTVVHADGAIEDSEDREYETFLNRVFLKKDIKLAEVPRVEQPGTGARWLYVWPDEREARDFAALLNKQLKTTHWVVRPLPEGTRTSIGPLRPITIDVNNQGVRYVFGLDTWSYRAIQGLFPGSCLMRAVAMSTGTTASVPTDADALRAIVRPTLLLLTGLNEEQLSVFDEFVVRDPVEEREILPPTPILPERSGACGDRGSRLGLENGEEVPGVPKSGEIGVLAGQ
jgi:hypothetical protein